MRVAVMIDGGHLRVLAKQANLTYNPDMIERVAHASVGAGEDLFRILYYDCAPYIGKTTLPVSGQEKEFKGGDGWLKELASRNLFAVRLGILKFRGYKPQRIPISPRPLTDDDFKADFEQKGVDMRIGLDIANFAARQSVERIVLISNDTDCIPAMKHARISGLHMVLAALPNSSLAQELRWHADLVRPVAWPDGSPARPPLLG